MLRRGRPRRLLWRVAMAHELRLPHTNPLVDLRTRIYRRDSDHIFHGNVSELARRQCQSGRQPQERIKRYSETARTKNAPYREPSSLPGTFFERMVVSCNLAEVFLFRLKYPDNLPGLSLLRLRYPANLAGIPDALIFFCLLFFHQGKALCRGRGSFPGTFFGCIIVSRNLV